MRLIEEHEVAMAIDRHTRPDGTLDASIFAILDEIPTAFDRENVKKQMRVRANDWKDDWKPFLFLRDAVRIIDEGGIEQETSLRNGFTGRSDDCEQGGKTNPITG